MQICWNPTSIRVGAWLHRYKNSLHSECGDSDDWVNLNPIKVRGFPQPIHKVLQLESVSQNLASSARFSIWNASCHIVLGELQSDTYYSMIYVDDYEIYQFMQFYHLNCRFSYKCSLYFMQFCCELQKPIVVCFRGPSARR